MDDGRKTKLRARSASTGADMAQVEVGELREAPVEPGAEFIAAAEALAIAPVLELVESPKPDQEPAAEQPPVADQWPATVAVTNHSRICIVEPVTGAMVGPACTRDVVLVNPSHARQVIANIKATLRINSISANEVTFAGLPSGV